MVKKTVLHILNSGKYSGAENVVITIINATKDNINSVYISRKGSIAENLKENKIKNYLVDRLTVFALKRIIKKVKPDIIHAHDFTAGIIAVFASGKIPVISHIHNNPPWIKKFCIKSIAYGSSCYKYKRILTVSESVMGEFIFGKFQRKKTEVIGNPVNIERVKKRALEEPYKENYDISFLGRLVTQKAPQTFVDIVHEIKKRKPDVRAVMVGDGELMEEIEKKIIYDGLEENIVLLGFQKNPYKILNNSKVLCMPSKWEGFGLAAIEALALGKPVIASPVGGLVNIVDASCGNLCSTGSEMAKEIYELLSKKEVYDLKSKGAFIRSEELENLDSYIERIALIYQEILEESS